MRKLVLTASGGPFRGWPAERLHAVGPEDALRHPTWQMGRKITIDSATLMNKGLEVIEAHWLFDVPASRIDVVVHPQSIVHLDGGAHRRLDHRATGRHRHAAADSVRVFVSGTVEALLPALDLTRCGALEFEAPDTVRFPCLRLAYDALVAGGTMPVALNAANEVAVDAFLAGRLPFPAIAQIIERTLSAHDVQRTDSLASVREADRLAREYSRALTGSLELPV